MKEGADERAAGRSSEGEGRDAEAAAQLDMAGKSASSAAAKLAAGMPKSTGAESRLADAVREARDQVRGAIPRSSQPPAPSALQNAAQALRQAAQLAGNQMRQGWPQPGPAAAPGGGPGPLLLAGTAQAWGDLPGEVRARL